MSFHNPTLFNSTDLPNVDLVSKA